MTTDGRVTFVADGGELIIGSRAEPVMRHFAAYVTGITCTACLVHHVGRAVAACRPSCPVRRLV